MPSKYESKNNFPLPVKGSRGDKSIEVVATGSFQCSTEMRDDWFQRGRSLPSPPSVSSKSCSHTFLRLLINRVARSFVNQMHLNGFPPQPPPTHRLSFPSSSLKQLYITSSYSWILLHMHPYQSHTHTRSRKRLSTGRWRRKMSRSVIIRS